MYSRYICGNHNVKVVYKAKVKNTQSLNIMQYIVLYKPTPRFARCRLALVYYRRCAAPTPSRRWRASAACHALQ